MERLATIEALLGGAAWLALLLGPPLAATEVMATIHRLLLLAVLVVAPLALAIAPTPGRARGEPLAYRAALLVEPVAAACAVASFFAPAGARAALLAAPWALFTALVALYGLGRLLSHGLARAEEVCVDAGLIYLPVGAGWLLFSRAGAAPAGFGEPVVALTAVHFHYAGFVAPIIAGLAGRRLRAEDPGAARMFGVVAAGIVLGMPLVAAGIAASRALEVAGVAVFTTSLLALAGLVIARVVPRVERRAPRALLLLSACALAAGMVLAAGYACGLVTIPAMVRSHGWTNAVGFGLAGALAWRGLRPKR